MSQVSIIIPAFNESRCLKRTLRHLQLLDPPAHEVLVVDGGSRDDTVAIAQTEGVKVLCSEQKGRSPQMNLGATVASGDILCFLHADTLVPDDLTTVIEHTLADPAVACGGFISLMAGKSKTRWGFSLHNFLKTYYAPLIFRPHLFFRGLRLLFGDQVMFCRRKHFLECGGFNENLPILEDAELCLKLLKQGRIQQINRIVQSSDRRVEQWGSLKATAIYAYVGYLWGIGVSAQYLQQFYEDVR